MSEKREVVPGVVRAALTGLLLFMVYGETGFWTVVTLTLMTLGFETQLWLLKGEDDE